MPSMGGNTAVDSFDVGPLERSQLRRISNLHLSQTLGVTCPMTRDDTSNSGAPPQRARVRNYPACRHDRRRPRSRSTPEVPGADQSRNEIDRIGRGCDSCLVMLRRSTAVPGFRRERTLLGLCLFCVAVSGCGGAEDGGGDAGTTSASSGARTPTSDGTTSGTTTSDTTSAGTTLSDTTGPAMLSCGDAQSEAECDALAPLTFQCSWLTTRRWAIGEDGTCEDLGMADGRCVTSFEDSGCGDEAFPTCPDNGPAVFYDPTTVDSPDGIELLVATDLLCTAQSGYSPCEFDPDGGSATTGGSGTGLDPTWAPPQCRCACSPTAGK